MIIEIAVIGAGVMGKNHARTLSRSPEVHLAGIVDRDADAARTVATEVGCAWATNLSQLGPRVDAAVVCVPTEAHADTAIELLERGVHVLVEKPIASSIDDGERMIAAAQDSGAILAVGHIERFNPVALQLKDYVGSPRFIQTRRLSPYSDRINEGVIGDLMVHDIDLVLSLVSDPAVERVEASAATIRSSTEDLASALITFRDGTIASLTASRVSQQKIREIEVTQDDMFISADLLRQSLQINHGTQVDIVDDGGKRRFQQSSVVEIPYLSQHGEPLRLELQDFVRAVSTRQEPLVTGADGLAALRLVQEIQAQASVGQLAT